MLGTSLQLPNGLIVLPDNDVPVDHYICNGENKVFVNEYDFKRLWDSHEDNEVLSTIILKLKAWPAKLKRKYENTTNRKIRKG